MTNLTDQTKKVLKKVQARSLSKAKASRILGVSRKTVYVWLKHYGKDKENRLKRKNELFRDITGIIVANFRLGPAKIAQTLTKCGKAVSSRTVWRLLKESELNTWRLRREFSRDYRKPSQAKDPALIGHLRLTPETRKRMVEAVIVSGRPVNEIVSQYGISRKTFAKWKKRYLAVHSAQVNMLSVLADQHPEGVNHPRGASEAVTRAVLNLVVQSPELSSHKIAERLRVIGNHGAQNVLRRNSLNTYARRLAFSQTSAEAVTVLPATGWLNRLKSVFDKFIPSLAPAPPPVTAFKNWKELVRIGGLSVLVTAIVSSGLVYWVRILASTTSNSQTIGLIFASTALIMGMLFFLYSLKYYLTVAIVLSYSQREGEAGANGRELLKFKGSHWLTWLLGALGGNGNGNGNGKNGQKGPVGLEPDLGKIELERHPKIAIHIPFYNEKKVVERAIEAALDLHYPNYEVVLVDDSTDETTDIIRNIQQEFLGKGEQLKTTNGKGYTLTEVEVKQGLVLKHIHRASRLGFKGGALGLALKLTDRSVEFISVFDADFVPYPDILELFLKYFKAQNEMKEDYAHSNVAAVQGYQWHVLNKSENWITRGVRSEYSGSYVIERSGIEIYGGLKQISGSVYMIRRDVLQQVGWGESITEDFELTLKLYGKGYRVVYTPYIQAPAECVSTLKRLIRQRMRWAEGHSQNIRHMFRKLITNPRLTLAEKLEFVYLSPYYLQAGFFLIGTIAWLISETVFPARLPFWTSLWGWSLVLTNMLALPLMNAVGLFLEESEEKDYLGLASFLALSYILVPFQAYAAVKGFLEEKEGPWFRTPKTGRITDIFTRGKFYRFIQGIIPGKVAPVNSVSPSQYLALATANSRFDSFKIRRRQIRWAGNLALVLLLSFSLVLLGLTPAIQSATPALASNRQISSLTQQITPAVVEEQKLIDSPEIVRYPTTDKQALEYIFHPEPRVRTKFENKEIELTLKAINQHQPAINQTFKENGTYIYPDIMTKADLRFTPGKKQLTEEIVLKGFMDIQTISYDLKTVDLEVALLDNEIFFADKAGGMPLFHFAKPYLYEQGNPEEKSLGVKYVLSKTALGWQLDKELTDEGRQWLADPQRVFPIVIDPTQYTNVIQASIDATDANYGSTQRKIGFSTRGAQADAFYAVYEEASGVDVFWTRCTAPCDGSTNTWGNDTEMDDEVSDDDQSPTLWMEGTTLYAAWFDNGSDGPKWRSWDTTQATETANQNACQADDVGTTTNMLVSIAVDDSGDVYTAAIDDAQAATEITISKSTSACSNSDLSVNGTAGGLTQGDAMDLVTKGESLLMIYNDGDLSASAYVDDGSPAWDQTNIDINGAAGANASENFSVATDGTDVWVIQDSGGTGTEMWKCAACNLASQSWAAVTPLPFSSLSNGSYVSLGYISTTPSNYLVAMYMTGTGTGEVVNFKTSNADTIEWSSNYTFGFTAGASGLDHLSATMNVSTDDQFAATVLETTNSEFEFSTLPENIWLLLLTLPLLPAGFNYLKRKRRASGG